MLKMSFNSVDECKCANQLQWTYPYFFCRGNEYPWRLQFCLNYDRISSAYLLLFEKVFMCIVWLYAIYKRVKSAAFVVDDPLVVCFIAYIQTFRSVAVIFLKF